MVRQVGVLPVEVHLEGRTQAICPWSIMRRIKTIFWWCYMQSEAPLSYADALQAMPDDEQVEAAQAQGIHRLILFGSRATGRFSEKSDIDLALSGGCLNDFKAALEEECPTLLFFDFINMDQGISEKLSGRIAEEGVVLYEVCQL